MQRQASQSALDAIIQMIHQTQNNSLLCMVSFEDHQLNKNSVTWNLGKIYSATWKVLVKTCPLTSTEMFQFPRTGLSAISTSEAQTP